MATVSVTVSNITDDECADIMVTAIEGGINYWAVVSNVQRYYDNSLSWQYKSFNVADAYDTNDAGEPLPVGFVNYDTIRTGVNRIVSGEVEVSDYIRDMVLANFQDDEPMDADGSDAVIQSGLLGSLTYG